MPSIKSLSLFSFLFLFSTSAAFSSQRKPAQNDFPDGQVVLGLFLKEMPKLKTLDGRAVSEVLAEDLIQHFSGSEGNRVKIKCEDPFESLDDGQFAVCTLTVKIIYGHHGAENGITEQAIYQLEVKRIGSTLSIADVNRSLLK